MTKAWPSIFSKWKTLITRQRTNIFWESLL